MKPDWSIFEPAPSEVVESLGFPPLQAQLLYNRGLSSRSDALSFLSPSTSDVHDPLLLPDMDRAVARLRRAVSDGELIGVFGDFDIDGVSGTAVVMNGLSGLGARVVPYVPDRVDEGHGLNADAVRSLADKGVTVLVTVDCGADADTEVEHARSLGVDCIVTDHHTMLEDAPYPAAEALVNPNRPDSRYPFDHLTGVGLAYKLVQAVFDDAGKESPEALLELVALGTVGDVGPLTGENRYFVSEGIRRMSRTGSPGLRALIEVSGYGDKPLDAMALSFGLIPRLNAPGRLDDAEISLKLLTSTEPEKARAQAALMEQYNRQRQALTRTAVGQADAQVSKRWPGSLPQVIMIGRKDWHPGILGLVAARIAEKHGRPAIAVSVGERESRASARSVKSFGILDILSQRSELFLKYGGHQRAAGFTIPNQHLRTLADHMESLPPQVTEDGTSGVQLSVDLVAGPSLVEKELFEFTQKLAPFGEASPRPRFEASGLRVAGSRRVGSGRHLKLRIDDGQKMWDAIAFRQGHLHSRTRVGSYIDIAYGMETNTWQGRTSLQLVVDDFSVSG